MQASVVVLCLVMAVASNAQRSDVQQTPRKELVERCQEDFVGIAGRCYRFLQQKKSWDSARSTCQSMGATLASILTSDQYFGLLNRMASSPGRYWTSGKYQSGTWIWSATGENVSDQWWGRKPWVSSNKCIYFCSYTRNYWASSCSRQLKFICERPMDTEILDVPAV